MSTFLVVFSCALSCLISERLWYFLVLYPLALPASSYTKRAAGALCSAGLHTATHLGTGLGEWPSSFHNFRSDLPFLRNRDG
eukprot:g14249.t1